MPSMTSFSVEVASICFGFFLASSLIVPSLLVAYSARSGKTNVSSLMTMVVCFTLSLGSASPSRIAETSFQVPCSPSKSFLDAGSRELSFASDTPMAATIRNCAFVVTLEQMNSSLLYLQVRHAGHGLALVKEQIDGSSCRIKDKCTAFTSCCGGVRKL